MNSDIQKALKYVNDNYKDKVNFYTDDEVNAYWENKNAFTWENICEFAHMKVRGYLVLYKFALGLLIHLIESGQYNGEYKDKLERDLPNLKTYYDVTKCNISEIFEKNYDEIAYITITDALGVGIRRIANVNPVFRDLFIEFVEMTREVHHQSNKTTDYHFPISIGDQDIQDYKDINSETFWTQIRYYQNLYATDDFKKDKAIKTVARFYRWLITKFSDFDFFAGSSNLSTELVMSNSLVKNINRDAYFTTFSNTEDLGDRPLICFIIRNLDSRSTRLKKVDQFVLSTESIETSAYRCLINRYVQNAASVTEATWCGFINYVVNALHFIEQMKMFPEYPNPNIYNLNTAEAIMVRNLYEKDHDHTGLSTRNNRIGAARRFFQWCQSSNYLTFDDTFFDYLSQYEEPNKYHGNAISDEDLQKISQEFKNACENDPSYLPYYAIFLIQIETEFRVSQICSLKVSTLQPTMKSDQFLLYSNTKTSNGRKTTQPICLTTKKSLEAVISLTQELRDESVSTAFAEKIFLRRNFAGIPVPIDSHKFLEVFQEICMKAGVRKYTSRNLRDTHMTKAFEFILKTGKSDLEMGLLSKHTYIDTTKNHYIEMELTKMLESTYQVVLDNPDINQRSRVLSELPESLKDDGTIVEGGCGHCKSAMCAVQGSTPCLICDNFVTTAAHKQYFVKMIDMVDRKLHDAVIPHEIEDLNLMKKLYVNWLREICIHEEEENAELICN